MDNSYSEILKNELEKRKEEYLGYLKDLVAIDTRDLGHGIDGGKEKEGQEYLYKLFEKIGADSIRKDPMREESIKKCLEEYGEGNPGHNYEDRYNLYADFGAKGSKKTLMFNGHIDTMTPGDETKWTYPPHEPTVSKGRLYGLGSCDMKAGLVAATMAVKLLKDADIELPVNVKICSVCDEEGGGNGSMQAIMSGERADAVVVCEPTSLKLIAAHMGFVFFRVSVTGRANHSGEKQAGVSAIEKAVKLIRALEELEHKWLLTHKHPLLPAPNLNVGTIHGGSAGSTVAGDCCFELCIHYLPNVMSYESVYKEFTDTIDLASRGDEWLCENKPQISMYQSGGAFEQDTDAVIVSAFKKAYNEALGKKLDIVGSPAGCDSRLWKNIAKSDVVQFGPGNLKECHAIDEYVELDQFYKSISVYAELILEYAKKQED